MEDRYVFLLDWFDTQAEVNRRYQLTYFLRDNTIEMWDTKLRRPFLKRSEYPGLCTDDLFLGAVLTIHARSLTVADYADEYTRNAMEGKKSKSVVVFTPDASLNFGLMLHEVMSLGLRLSDIEIVRLSFQEADALFDHLRPALYFDDLVDAVSGGPILAAHFVGDDCISRLNKLIGPENAHGSDTMRGRYGKGGARLAVHSSPDAVTANRQTDLLFTTDRPTTALFCDCSCCVIRPHAISSSGLIIDALLQAGMELSALKMFRLDRTCAEELLQVYNTVLPEFAGMTAELSSGPCIAMEIRGDDIVNSLRKLVGPYDPEIGKVLRPDTLRARFGIDRVKNAVHCSDLEEDGFLEVEYFFGIMRQTRQPPPPPPTTGGGGSGTGGLTWKSDRSQGSTRGHASGGALGGGTSLSLGISGTSLPGGTSHFPQ